MKINYLKTLAAVFLLSVVLYSCEKEEINTGETDKEMTIADFSEIELEEESYWNGSDESGVFISGNVSFPNYFTDWGDGVTSWSGFSVSNITDNETTGYENEYSSITGSGVDGKPNYAVAYISDPETYENYMAFDMINDAEGNSVDGMYITNSTYAYYIIKDGGDYNDPFEEGDWFLATFTAFLNEEEAGSLEYYLADYRDGEQFILDYWEWIDLTSLGEVDKIEISLSSSDEGDYGMNTPSYICIGQVATHDN